jgi:hypothetical protein
MTSKLSGVMILLDGSTLFIERYDPFKIDLLKQLKKLFFGLNRYNGLERIDVRSTELKRYNDSSNRYTFHESL